VLQVSRLLETHWENRTVKGKIRYGLISVAKSGPLTKETAGEIRELQLAVSEAQARCDQTLQATPNVLLLRGDEILGVLRSGLSYLLEDGKHPEGAAQLAQVRDAHSSTDSTESVAMALEGFAELGETFTTELQAFDNFPVSIIDEALQVARDLRERNVSRKTGELASEQREALALRNRLLGAMMDRVGAARRAIRYVFRDDPVVLKQAGSDYERTRRARGGESDVAATPDEEVPELAPEQESQQIA